MEITVELVSHNSGGGHYILSYLGEFLLMGAPEFGSAIKTIDIYAHVPVSEPHSNGMDLLRDRYEQRLKTLPQIWFKRKRRLIEIAYHSKLVNNTAIKFYESKPISVTLFHKGCHEIVSVMALIQKRLKRADKFEFGAFQLHLRNRLEQMPTKKANVKKLFEELWAAEEKRLKAYRASGNGHLD